MSNENISFGNLKYLLGWLEHDAPNLKHICAIDIPLTANQNNHRAFGHLLVGIARKSSGALQRIANPEPHPVSGKIELTYIKVAHIPPRLFKLKTYNEWRKLKTSKIKTYRGQAFGSDDPIPKTTNGNGQTIFRCEHCGHQEIVSNETLIAEAIAQREKAFAERQK